MLFIFFGGKNKIKKNHMGTNHFVNIRNDKIFKKKKFLVNSFHDYCIEKKDIGIEVGAGTGVSKEFIKY